MLLLFLIGFYLSDYGNRPTPKRAWYGDLPYLPSREGQNLDTPPSGFAPGRRLAVPREDLYPPKESRVARWRSHRGICFLQPPGMRPGIFGAGAGGGGGRAPGLG